MSGLLTMFFGMTSVSNGGFIPSASLICLILSERKSIKQSVSPSEQHQNKIIQQKKHLHVQIYVKEGQEV